MTFRDTEITITPNELFVLETIGDANARGQTLRDREISDITEIPLEEVKRIIGSLVSKGYIKGVVQ